MRGLFAAIRRLVVPYGAPSGTSRIVIGSDVPAELQTFYAGSGGMGAAILLYNNASAAYEYIGTVNNTSATVFGSVSSTGQVAEAFLIQPGTGAVGSWQAAVHNAVNLTFGGGTAIALAAGTKNGQATSFVTDVPLQASDPVNGGAEPWHAVTLLNNFSNAGAGFPNLSVRRVASPPNEIELVGTIKSGATVASGTKIAALGANYQPINQQGHVAINFGTNGAMTLTLDTNGDVKLWGVWANGASIYVNCRFVLDL